MSVPAGQERAHGILAVDSGGSGLRVAVGTAGRGALAERNSRVPVRTGATARPPRRRADPPVSGGRGLRRARAAGVRG
ncbi:hypothetical protein ACWD25_59545 [Streptomyces sp. NPDC002920]